MPERDGSGRFALLSRLTALGPVEPSSLAARRTVVVGCGALGSSVAEHLARAGVGVLRVVDRDVVEPRNLAHQLLYTETDAARRRWKATAAAERLREVNSGCAVEGVVADYSPANALALADGADVLLDCADNLDTKFLLNDVAVATGTPLVYAGCAGTEGSVLAVVPGRTHCLRCLWPEPGAAAARRTCESRGLLPGAAAVVAAIQATEALKLLLRLDPDELSGLVRIDVWHAVLRRVRLPAADSSCPACGDRDLRYLSGAVVTTARELCGDDTVLLAAPAAPDLDRLRARHAENPSLRVAPGLVQWEVDGCRIVSFDSGRTLIHGAGNLHRAKALYARHVLG